MSHFRGRREERISETVAYIKYLVLAPEIRHIDKSKLLHCCVISWGHKWLLLFTCNLSDWETACETSSNSMYR